jgi:hypothetical protein
MMQIIYCKECGGGSSIGLESVSVNVELSMHHHCDICRHGRTETQTYFFCSLACFLAYVNKVAQGKAEFKFKVYDQMTGQSVDPID